MSDVIIHFLSSDHSHLTVEELKDWVSHYEEKNNTFRYDPRYFALTRKAISTIEQGSVKDGESILKDIVAVLDDPADSGLMEQILFAGCSLSN